MADDWGARTILPAVLRSFSKTWARVAAADAILRLLALALLSPAVGFLLRWSLQRGGTQGVVTDQGILFFFLSPVGIATLLGIGSITAALYFAEIGALLVIPAAERRGARVWPLGTVRFTLPQAYPLLRLALRAFIRLLLLAAPFVAIAGLVYGLMLTTYDIYFYLTVKPPEFWIAATLIGIALSAGLALVIRRLLGWAFALPILLFEDLGPTAALAESVLRTRSRLLVLCGWLAAWGALGVVMSTGTAAVVGLIGRVVIRPDAPLGVIAAGTGVVGLISIALYVATLVFSLALLVSIVDVLYWGSRPPDASPRPLERLSRLDGVRWRPIGERFGVAVAVMVAGALVYLGVSLVNRAGIDPSAEVTAHRGAKYERPENTIPAIERAIELGADWVEIDVQLTADGEVIVVHDRDFVRVAGSSLRAEESALAELRVLDVGSWFGAEFRGVRAPTLDEVLATCRDRVGVNIELKYFGPDRGLASHVIETVEQHGMAEQVMLMSFDHGRVAEAKALRPDWEMGLLLAVALGDALRLEADFYAVPPSLASAAFIRAAKRLERDVHVWTVDDPVRISAMMSRGADNLYTGSTEVVRRVIAERAELGRLERLLIDIAADIGVVRVPPAPVASREDA